MSTTVLLVDDHAIVREGLRKLLEDSATDIEVIGEAADGREAIELTAQLQPQVVLLDITMPGLGGIEAARQIRAHYPMVAVVFLTVHESEEYFFAALQCGAHGYLPKSAPSSEVIEAIRSAARDEVVLHPSVARFLLQKLVQRDQAGAVADPYNRLTTREREILRLVVEGLTTREIADRLALSPNTIHHHRTSLMRKLGLHNRLDLLRFWLHRGLDNPAD
jgi:two-component system response regulator NreC